MPNIMLTYRCNLHCSYCFANEFVNKNNTDITIKNFLKAVSFATRTGPARIGLIGGEPTIHPGFPVIMELLNNNPKVKGITLYTNGLLLDKYIQQFNNQKIHILINCNTPIIIGEKAFDRMQMNLDKLMHEESMKERVHLGINLYSDDMDYTYIINLLQRYKMHSLRISLTVPDFSTCGQINALENFKKRKPFLLDFFREMDSIQVLPYYDCNCPPYCIWSEEEKEWLEKYTAKYPDEQGNLTGYHSSCFPVIDILPNLQAVRCFGMSDYMKVSIEDFRNISDLTSYFINEIDSVAYKMPACKECANCYEQKVRHCVTGCMGFKANGIRASNDVIKKMGTN